MAEQHRPVRLNDFLYIYSSVDFSDASISIHFLQAYLCPCCSTKRADKLIPVVIRPVFLEGMSLRKPDFKGSGPKQLTDYRRGGEESALREVFKLGAEGFSTRTHPLYLLYCP